MVLGLLVLGAAIFFNAFAVWDVTVEGNERYTDAEIEQLVLGEGYSNTLLLMAKKPFRRVRKYPFYQYPGGGSPVGGPHPDPGI